MRAMICVRDACEFTHARMVGPSFAREARDEKSVCSDGGTVQQQVPHDDVRETTRRVRRMVLRVVAHVCIVRRFGAGYLRVTV